MSTIDLDALLAKRRESTGSTGFPVEFAGRTWHFTDPELASSAWKDQLRDLYQDYEDNLLSVTAAGEELAVLFLGDDAADFLAEVNKLEMDAMTLLQMAAAERVQALGKIQSRQNMRRSPRR